MPASDATSIPALEQANEMYWGSDRTVDEIVRELNVGRSTLYSAVRPIDAGASCPECGDAMVFTNRSNREARTATCPSCATERRLGEAETGDRARSRERASSPAEGGSARSRRLGGLAAVSPQRAAMVGGAAALGVVLGAAATRALREMR